MDSAPERLEAANESDWESLWRHVPQVPKLVRQLGGESKLDPSERLDRAAYFVAGKLEDEDFHLFANAGQPLLKRQRDAWFDEILFHVPCTAIPGFYCPVSVEVLVSFEPLRELRAKISSSYSMVPPFVAKANIGQFLMPPRKILWNLEFDSSLSQIGGLIEDVGLKWIDRLCDPISLEANVIAGDLPFVSDSIGLELVLATGGRNAARRVIETWLDSEDRGPILKQELQRMQKRLGPAYRTGESNTDLAVIAVAFDLISPRRAKVL